MKPGDKLICYVTKISRWVGVLEVTSNYYVDTTPFFHAVDDPFIIRFKVDPKAWLPLDHAIPIHAPISWDNLSFTKGNGHGWTSMVRGSLRKLEDKDGLFLENLILKQANTPQLYPLTEEDRRRLQVLTVRTNNSQEIVVTIPEDEIAIEYTFPPAPRDSIRVQALLAQVGETMGMKIWLPKNDRNAVLDIWRPKAADVLLTTLPMNYDNTTLQTVEFIDVLWIRSRSIVRAFEVEHTTAVYSGILRMADLMALQPNMRIKAHIVAPIDRRDKVLKEISRPVFAVLESGPLAKSCTFLSYTDVEDLSNKELLGHMNESVLDEYAESAESADF